MVVAFFGSTILAVVLLRFIPVYFTPLMFIRCAEQIKDGESIKMHHHWVPLDKISPHLPVAVMASEDQRFLLHHGFDYKAIEKAVEHNMSSKKSVAQAPYRSRLQRTCSCGRAVHGYVKGSKFILLR